MILDTYNAMADAKSLNTGGAGTYLLSDVIDLGTAGRNIGVGDPPTYCIALVSTTATSGGSATLQLILASDAQAAIATDGSATAHYTTSAIPVATLVEGYQVMAFPLPLGTYERYLGVLQVTAVAAFTAGKIKAYLASDLTQWKAYADAAN